MRIGHACLLLVLLVMHLIGHSFFFLSALLNPYPVNEQSMWLANVYNRHTTRMNACIP